MSQVLNPLQTQELLETIPTTVTLLDLNDRVRERLREEKAARKISERDLAAFCQWSQSKVAQKLGGHTAITLNELETLCQALGIAPTEAVRDRGLKREHRSRMNHHADVASREPTNHDTINLVSGSSAVHVQMSPQPCAFC